LALGEIRWPLVLEFFLLANGYCLLSWLILRRFYRRDGRPDLSLVFLALDVVVWAYAIYVSGATRSWLYPVVLAHVADQTHTHFRRVLGFAHWGVFCYFALVLIVALDPDSAVDWRTEAAKIAFLYGFAVYISLTAKTAERLRGRLVDTVRHSRE